MNKILPIICCLVTTSITNAQNPDFSWAKQFDGSNVFVTPNSLTLDASGNVLSTGVFKGKVDFDPGSGESFLTSTNNSNDSKNDLLISKLDADGKFIWARQFGGTELKEARSIGTDAAGNVYTTGFFWGTVDFDPGAGTTNLTSLGFNDIFISKLDAAGNFVWVKQIGGLSADGAYAIAVDPAGNIFATGYFNATVDFDPGTGVSNLTTYLNAIFILKLDASGNFVWVKSIGTEVSSLGKNKGQALVLDALGNLYVSGTFAGTTDFNPGAQTNNLTSVGADSYNDIFLLKLDASGNYAWAKQFSGTGFKVLNGLAVDASGNVLTTGLFEGTVDFDPGSAKSNLTVAGGIGNDVFISKLDSHGDFVWAKQLEGKIRNVASVALDVAGNVYSTGNFYGTADFDPNAGVSNLTVGQKFGDDLFILKLDVSGSFVWVKQITGGGSSSGNATGNAITVSNSGSIYTAGTFYGTYDFDSGTTVLNLKSNDGIATDMFIHKMSGAAVTAVNEFPKSGNSFAIYPNPSNGSFTINLKVTSDIRIYNAMGKGVFAEKMLVGNQQINLQNEPNGIYFIKAITDKNQQTYKLIKQ